MRGRGFAKSVRTPQYSNELSYGRDPDLQIDLSSLQFPNSNIDKVQINTRSNRPRTGL